jgi:hypothetical protein
MKTAESKKEEMSTTKLVSNTNNNDDKNMPSKKETSSNINILNNNIPNSNISNNIEFNKLQGFDVLEKLPPKSVNDTYNQEFYNTLDNLKFLSLSIPDEDKLFYHFEQNENASISANAGQVLKSFMELFMNKMTIRKTLRQCKKEFKAMKIDFDNIEPNITEEIRIEIIKMEKRLQNFLVEQKTETIRLIKEIANLQKEKEKLKDDIEACYERLNKLEKIIGSNKDYNKTVSDVKLGNKNIEVKKKKSVGPGVGIEDIENNGDGADNNINARLTGNTVSNPGEGLSERFNVNTIGSNNVA